MPIFDHFDFLAPLYETFIPPKDPQEMWALAYGFWMISGLPILAVLWKSLRSGMQRVEEGQIVGFEE
jgi:hypothetical protein